MASSGGTLTHGGCHSGAARCARRAGGGRRGCAGTHRSASRAARRTPSMWQSSAASASCCTRSAQCSSGWHTSEQASWRRVSNLRAASSLQAGAGMPASVSSAAPPGYVARSRAAKLRGCKASLVHTVSMRTGAQESLHAAACSGEGGHAPLQAVAAGPEVQQLASGEVACGRQARGV